MHIIAINIEENVRPVKAAYKKYNILAAVPDIFCILTGNIMAIIIIFIGITALVIMNIYSDSWGIFGIYILGYFLNALRISIIKILLDKWYYSTYKLLFIIGSIGIFLVVLIMPFSLLIKSGTFTFKSIYVDSFQIFKYEKISILYIVIVYLMGLLFNV